MIEPTPHVAPEPKVQIVPKWDLDKAIRHLNLHARAKSHGKCAAWTREAIEAGGLTLKQPASADACDYGTGLVAAGFKSLGQLAGGYLKGDVVIIQRLPVKDKKHPEHGHMAMFNGTIWVSDFKQMHGLYPGERYRKLKPHYTIYRYPDAAPLSSSTGVVH